MESKPLPVLLRKFVFQDALSADHAPYLDQDIDAGQEAAQVRLLKIGTPAHRRAQIPGYFVMSSAPPNIENAQEMQESELQDAALGVKEIASHLYDVYTQNGVGRPDPELVIAVHGYNSGRSSVRDWYKNIFQYINKHDPAIPRYGNQVFIGYRWPSENIELQRLWPAFTALPPLPQGLMTLGIMGALVLLLLEIMQWDELLAGLVLVPVLMPLLGLATIIMTLVILRMVVYFRDRYRAENFGVLDLVELLRQIDRELVNLKAADIQRHQSGEPDGQPLDEQAAKFWKQTHRKVKLSFLGHSMGGFVVTNVVRILSDVFDTRSIRNKPPADIGSVFRLERLILTSPDIPILTIVSSRANFLSSSLRRFAESYLFSSEGDLALRIASATANYFTFPSTTEAMGYRLGNVALKADSNAAKTYGIVNLSALDQHLIQGVSLAESIARNPQKVMEHLFLTYDWTKKDGYNTLAKLFKDRVQTSQPQLEEGAQPPKMTIADLFTYVDCTDYKDVTFSVNDGKISQEPQGLLTRAQGKKALNWWDYGWLMVDGMLGKRDVHGGYFQGSFTQSMIYRIAFLGFTGYLKTLDDDPKMAFDPHVALSKLHMQCRTLGIRSFLSPIRYRVNIQGENITDNKQALLAAIDQESTDILQSDQMMESLKEQGFEVIVK